MKVPYTKSGKCGDTVWQWNGHAQISYPYYVPYDPRTPAQVELRKRFGTLSARWRRLTPDQRERWRAAAKRQKTRKRLGQSWPLNGLLYFMRVNLRLANQGLAQVVLPPAQPPLPREAAALPPESPNPAGLSLSFTFPCMAQAGSPEPNFAGGFTCYPGSPVWLSAQEMAALRSGRRDTS